MNVGDFDKLIKLFTRTGTVDAHGTVGNTYGDELELFAEVTEITGAERFKAEGQQDMSLRIARFTFWYVRPIKAADRLEYDGESWDILNVRTIGRNEYSEVMAQIVE